MLGAQSAALYTSTMPYRTEGPRLPMTQLGASGMEFTFRSAQLSPWRFLSERALDAIPGLLTWLALALSMWAAIFQPRLILWLAAVLGAYMAGRFILAALAIQIGYHRIARWQQIDWRAQYEAEKRANSLPWEAVHHLVLIPNYRESLPVLRHTLTELAQQAEAKPAMTVILAMEAGEEAAIAKGERLQREFRPHFAHFYFTVHPRGIRGEIPGKSSNIAWAVRWARRKLVEDHGYDIDRILVTTMDADVIWHPRHFAALTALFANHPQRHERFWQAPIRYHRNIWSISPPMRLLNAYSAAMELAYLSAGWWKALPISSYSLSLRLLQACDYWDVDVISDEWHMFIKAFFLREGRVRLERVFLPFSALATGGDTLWQVIRNRYRQTLRHAWGSKEVGYMLARMLEHPEVPFRQSLSYLWRVAHDILMGGAGWVTITLGSQLPLLLHPALWQQQWQAPWRELPLLVLQLAFGLVLLSGVLIWRQDVAVRPPWEGPLQLGERILSLLSFPLLPLLTLLFVGLPVVHAQTQLLLGLPLQFRVTEKG